MGSSLKTSKAPNIRTLHITTPDGRHLVAVYGERDGKRVGTICGYKDESAIDIVYVNMEAANVPDMIRAFEKASGLKLTERWISLVYSEAESHH